MKIEKATRGRGRWKTEGKGVVLFGNHPDTLKWFERWFPSEEVAIIYCQKRGWDFAIDCKS